MGIKMKNKFVLLILLFPFILSSFYAQTGEPLEENNLPRDTVIARRLQKIYRNLEYNTTAFNDLKNKWIVTDPLYVREIYNRFIVKNALYINGKKPPKEVIEEKTKDIYEGTVFIELRKRYYDDEIEDLRFFTESKFVDAESMYQPKKDYFFDPINDNIQIKEILGETIYSDLSNQFYAHTDLTKEAFGKKEAYNFDIQMSIFDPEVQFWSQTTQQNNKYLLSFIGRWGSDQIVFPGWYYPDMFLGLKLSYIDYIRNNEPYVSYFFEVATGVPVRFPVFEFNNDGFGPRLFHSGNNIYAKLGGNPLMLISKDLENFEISLDALFSITEYDTRKFNLQYVSQFYSNRNFVNVYVKYKDIFNVMDFGWFYAGLGYSNHDMVHYLYNPEVSNLEVISNKTNHLLKLQIGLNNSSGMLMHDVAPVFNYNISESIGYAGIKTRFMLNNIFGFEFKFLTAFGTNKSDLPFYKLPSYILFTPLLRINY